MSMTFVGYIHKLLTDMTVKVREHNPSKNNTSQLMGTALFWDTVQSYAKKQSDLAWDALEKEEIIDTSNLPEGEHILADNRDFAVVAKMSAPYKAFTAQEMCTLLAKSKYKVPAPFTMETIEKAKLPGKGRLTLNIVEKA